VTKFLLGFGLAVVLVAWIATSGETVRFARQPEQATAYQVQLEQQRHEQLMERRATRLASAITLLSYAGMALFGAGILWLLAQASLLMGAALATRAERRAEAPPRIVERIVYIERVPDDESITGQWREVSSGLAVRPHHIERSREDRHVWQ
jgi:hypothetical protein